MILLKVVSYNGAAVEGPTAQFDELGGSIGRADNNQLVLPDPERTISRVHARVVFRGGAYAVVDNGSNPISVNGVTLGNGREQALRPGDRLQIGGYAIVASTVTAASSSDPFADLFGDAAAGLAAPAKAAAPAVSSSSPAAPAAGAWPAAAAGAAAPRWATAPAPAVPSPYLQPARNPPNSPNLPKAPNTAPGPAAAPRGAALIPEDWDPFAPDPVTAAPPPGAAPRDAFADLPAGGGDSLDELFGLGSAPSGGDPLGAPPPQALLAQPNTARHADALQSLTRTATVLPASRSDHGSELNLPMPRQPLQAAPTAPAAPAALPQGAVFSWDEPAGVTQIVGVSRSPAAAPPPVPQTPLASAAAPTPTTPRQTLPSAAPETAGSGPARPPAAADAPQAAAAHAAGPASHGELLAALLAGLDAPNLRLDALTPATMQLLGQLLRESMRGTVELLAARAALKREMRAEMTMIVARENNPLKFSPTVEVALQHLLGPPVAGFKPAVPAVRDAFDDLRAHQLGVMAGMRAALDGVLGRFDPRQLEGKLTRRSAIDSLIPATRKARLWESFNELFAQLQSEAQDDFDELFGKAFLKAYEDQLERLQREPGPQ
jgi:type VI secretion system FHA domain protein